VHGSLRLLEFMGAQQAEAVLHWRSQHVAPRSARVNDDVLSPIAHDLDPIHVAGTEAMVRAKTKHFLVARTDAGHLPGHRLSNDWIPPGNRRVGADPVPPAITALQSVNDDHMVLDGQVHDADGVWHTGLVCPLLVTYIA
jgi:hypothetical protein